MADINLEAEQVVGEEEEAAPETKRGGIFTRKNLIIFGSIVVVEALVLFLVFDAISGGDNSAAAMEQEGPSINLLDKYSKPGRIELNDISIYDPSDPSPRGDRRFTFSIVLRIDGDAFSELQQAAEINEFAMDLVKDDIKEEVRRYLLRHGGHPLKNRDHQAKLGPRLKDHLNQDLTPLRGKILKVDVPNFQPSKY